MKFTATTEHNYSDPQLQFLNSFFKNCSDDFANNIIHTTYLPDTTIISTDDTCSYVYIVLEGRLQAIEERINTMLYNFTEISAFDILGDYELFTEHSSRIITLKTLSTTHCLTIPANAYLDWIRKDANALFLRIQILLKQIIGQTTFDRKNFFLNNKDRFLLFLYREYIRQAKNTITIKLTHDEIANYLGCSTRTVNRIIRNLNDEHYLKLSHGKILISKDQFQRIKLVVQSELLKDF